jgi:hypothetical protein
MARSISKPFESVKDYFIINQIRLKVPDEAQSLLALISRVNKEHPNEVPILVHCRWGFL